jgi:beta-galactosidase
MHAVRSLSLMLLLSLLGAGGARAQASAQDASPRVRLNLNADWRFQPGTDAATQPDERAWRPVTLPHTWNATDALDRDVAYRRGIGWYERRLEVPAALRGKRLFLYFEGANQVADVWVNGQAAGRHVGGYTAFAMDITGLIAGDRPNVILVRVDNRHDPDIPPLRADFTFYGGIYRDVWLLATEPVHIDVLDHASTGVFVDAPGLTAERAVVRTRVELRNDGPQRTRARVVSHVVDPAGHVVAEATSSLALPATASATATANTAPIAHPRLWSPEEPDLYTVRTEVFEGDRLVDRLDVPLGLRFYGWDAQQGFRLNGRPRQLHGVNRHQDFQGLGNAVPDAYHRRDLRTIKANGFDFLRLAHYPQDPAVLDEADRVGLILWEEIPVVDYITMSEGFSANAERIVTEMVRQHYDHPSVFFWGYMNEIMLTPPNPKPPGYDDAVLALAKRLNARVKAEDATRPTVMAIFGQDPIPALHDVPDVLGLNLYFGWYYGQLGEFGAYVDSLHAARPDRPLIISEYGAGGDERVHATAPVPFDYSAEYQQRLHQGTFSQILARPWLLGSALWNMFDFGAYGRDDARPNVNDKGLFTFDRRPKDVASYYRAMLRHDGVLHIATRDWPLRAGSAAADRTQEVTVYSDQPAVELILDGHALGTQPVSNGLARWSVTWRDGDNRLEARAGALADAAVVRYSDRTGLFTAEPGDAAEIAISAGARTQYVANGVAWEADRAYAPGSWGYVGGTAANTHHRILGTTDDPLLQTTREGASAYRFDVPDGRYQVELRFVETRHDAAGERVFAVAVNGVPAEAALDLAGTVGRWHARTVELVVDATGGHGVRIELPPAKGESTISAIRVRRIAGM